MAPPNLLLVHSANRFRVGVKMNSKINSKVEYEKKTSLPSAQMDRALKMRSKRRNFLLSALGYRPKVGQLQMGPLGLSSIHLLVATSRKSRWFQVSLDLVVVVRSRAADRASDSCESLCSASGHQRAEGALPRVDHNKHNHPSPCDTSPGERTNRLTQAETLSHLNQLHTAARTDITATDASTSRWDTKRQPTELARASKILMRAPIITRVGPHSANKEARAPAH